MLSLCDTNKNRRPLGGCLFLFVSHKLSMTILPYCCILRKWIGTLSAVEYAWPYPGYGDAPIHAHTLASRAF